MSEWRTAAFGAEPAGERLARIQRSPHYDTEAGAFRNPVPASTGPRPTGGRTAMIRALLSGRAARRPPAPVPVRTPDLGRPPASGLRLTWMGHSSVLAEIDGRRVLFDPVWGERCSPFTFIGPRRLHPVPLPLAELGDVDVVVISHDHYDHLDMPSIRTLARGGTRFAVPLGVGAHLERWGVPAGRIAELDWHESTRVADLTLTATPARHFCGRGLRNRQRTLWASWAVAGPEHRIFHSGDTGYFPGFADIGRDHGPFDVTMIQLGAYSEFWPDVHMTPDEALRTHGDLRGDVLLPIHWGTFNLAPHPWAEPAERTWRLAKEAGVRAAHPVPGQSFEPGAPGGPELPGTPWWRPQAAGTAAAVSRPQVGGPVEVEDRA